MRIGDLARDRRAAALADYFYQSNTTSRAERYSRLRPVCANSPATSAGQKSEMGSGFAEIGLRIF